MILVGNKSDLDRTVTGGEEFAKANGLSYVEISVKQDVNVDMVFDKLAGVMYRESRELGRLEGFKIQRKVEA